MADSKYYYEWLMVDTRDEQITHVYVALGVSGDSPMGVQGWHYKAFPANVPVMDILKNHLHEAVLWPQAAPPWQYERDRDDKSNWRREA